MIIGLEVRHYKAYKGQNFIPIGNEHNFVAFTGENGNAAELKKELKKMSKRKKKKKA